jgi:hypothetical protein
MFQLTHFFGYSAAIVFYYLLNRVLLPKVLGIQEDMPEDVYVEGMPIVAEVSAWRDRTGEEWCQCQEWGRKVL